MYTIILMLHSMVRWFVVLSLVGTTGRAYYGWLKQKTFSAPDHFFRHTTATIAHVQLLLGLLLYFISPIITYFLNQYSVAVHQREIRFFGMEHSLMMLVAVVLITMGSAKAKRKNTDQEKFKTIAIWFTLALIIIFVMIPWPFSPLVTRPYFRWL